jgi:hypothetical protein
MVEEPDMMAIGQHCALPGCYQLDFLPFTCGCCSKTYCLEHRGRTTHGCPEDGGQDEVVVCPLCARAIKIPPGADPNVVFERSERCVPAERHHHQFQ